MSKSTKTIIAIAVLAIIPALGACGDSPLGPEVVDHVEVERQIDSTGGGHQHGVLW